MEKDVTVAVVELNDENRGDVAEISLSMYLGEYCKYCDKQVTTTEELRTVVYAGWHAKGRIAHESCWNENNKVD
jgi:hypothetical protein